MGFLKPDSGRVIVAYEDITDFSESALRRIRKKVTMVSPVRRTVRFSNVAENILFSLELRDDYDATNKEDVVRRLLGLVDLADYADAYPTDLSTGYKARRGDRASASGQPECILYDDRPRWSTRSHVRPLADLMLRLKSICS
jgi:phospholipid/cholesterol/gamma-HCH transport system ATP-binding protein